MFFRLCPHTNEYIRLETPTPVLHFKYTKIPQTHNAAVPKTAEDHATPPKKVKKDIPLQYPHQMGLMQPRAYRTATQSKPRLQAPHQKNHRTPSGLGE